MRRVSVVDERPLAVDRLAERVHDAAEQRVADRAWTGSAPSRARPAPLRWCRPMPSTTAPIVSSSRFIASPTVPSSNSSSSLTCAAGRPETRAMPSPTSTMRPTCSAPTSGVVLVDVLAQGLGDLLGGDRQLGHQPASFCLVVVDSRCDSYRWLGETVSRSALEATAGRGVDAQVADLDQHAAEEVGLAATWSSTVLPVERARATRRGRARLCVVERAGRADAGDAPLRAPRRRSRPASRACPTTSRGRPPTIDVGREAHRHGVARLPASSVAHDAGARLERRRRGRVSSAAQFVVALDRCAPSGTGRPRSPSSSRRRSSSTAAAA